MIKKNKKGFTLVELLSVIVILSVVVLIATNAVIPAMDNARKQVLATEANVMIKSVYAMYTKEGATGTKCYTYDEVLEKGFIEKNDENYTGSFQVLVDENGKTSYKIWLSNGKNMIDGKSPDVSPDDVIASSEDASTVCGAD